jgi:hypothetical protein
MPVQTRSTSKVSVSKLWLTVESDSDGNGKSDFHIDVHNLADTLNSLAIADFVRYAPQVGCLLVARSGPSRTVLLKSAFDPKRTMQRINPRLPLSLSEIKYERSDDAGRRGRPSLRCSRGCELVASSAHPCSRGGAFGSDCSSSHNSAADGAGGALPRQSRGPNSPVGSNRAPARNIRSARVSGPRLADPGCPSPGYCFRHLLRNSRRSCRRINRPNRSRNDSVGTTNRSSAAIPSA